MGIAFPKLQAGEKIKGGEVITRMLAAEGVTKVFGIIDGTYFGFYSTMSASGIDLITPRHETSAAHMAGAYARLTGELGGCMASNGPGVANILPGVAVEHAEGNRVLLITSSRRQGIASPERGGTYQYFPHTEVTRPITKWSCTVPSIERLGEIMRRAMRVSFEGRPGVVHVDVPENLMNGDFEVDPQWFREPSKYRDLTPMAVAPAQVLAAAEILIGAERPVLHVGSGVLHAGAYDEVKQLAELLNAAITTSWGARAAVDERIPCAIPMQYVDAVNAARARADVVLALGSRVGETDWWGKPPYWGDYDKQRWIQVDIDAEPLANNRPVELPVRGDVKLFLQELIAVLEPRHAEMKMESREKALAELHKMCAKRRKGLDKHLKDTSAPMNSAHVATTCRGLFEDDAILVVDGGNSSIWAHFFHEVRTPNTVLGTAKMGMLGAGVSQALGAQVAYPDRQVYCIIGDGAMGFHMQEIETAVRNALPVIYLVLCDKQWGMVKINQQFALKPLKTLIKKSLSAEETINADLNETEFDQLGRSMGAHGERVADPTGLKGALERAKAAGRCAVIHVDVDPVKHMWAPNLRTFKDMHQEPKG